MTSRTTPVPRVSVLMPVFNGGRFLAAAVESIREQTFRDFELIAIDDGSTDQSACLLAQLAASDDRIRVIRQTNAGIVTTLNRALALAHGEYIARMDADDVALPSRLARQTVFLDDHPDVAVVGSAITLIDEEGSTIRDVDYPLFCADVSRFLIHVGNALAHPAIMMRRADIAALGGYRAAYRHAEDYDLWLQLSETRDLANLPDRLLLYRQHPAKASARHAAEQMLATKVAQLAAQARRAGMVDPTQGLTRLTLSDLDRFALKPAEKAAAALDIVEAAMASGAGASTPIFLEQAYRLLRQPEIRAEIPQRGVSIMVAAASYHLERGRVRSALKCYVLAGTMRPGAWSEISDIAFSRFIAWIYTAYRRMRRIWLAGLPG